MYILKDDYYSHYSYTETFYCVPGPVLCALPELKHLDHNLMRKQAQRGYVTCLKSHSWQANQGFESRPAPQSVL